MLSTLVVASRKRASPPAAGLASEGEDKVVAINIRLARHVHRELDKRMTEYLNLTTVALARFTPTPDDLASLLKRSAHKQENPLDVVGINREYLEYLRDSSHDLLAGDVFATVETGLTRAQAVALAHLSYADLQTIARHWPGTVFKFNGARLAGSKVVHSRAALFHTAAAVRF
ncbi:MAG: hypothetical protein D4R84_02580 [Rhodocyclaceae bacterium]|nr:MAG: hypothetical protein D4R84_02580 [Rhodocyclaceae bacterium]